MQEPRELQGPQGLQVLVDRQHTAFCSVGNELPFEEWQQNCVATYLRDCLSFYDEHPRDPLRWDAIALAHDTVLHYYVTRQFLAEGGGHGWFARSPGIVGPSLRSFVAQERTLAEWKEELRKVMMTDSLLNSAELARILVLADWVLDAEPADVDPAVYTRLAGTRAERQRLMDSPTTREMRRNGVPASAFGGRLVQAERWLRKVEERHSEQAILTAPPRHGRWFLAGAHKQCAEAYFYCLARTAPEPEYLAELRRYRRGSIVSTAALACARLKDWKMDRIEAKDPSLPLDASDAGLAAVSPGSPEAIYLEFLNAERQANRVRGELRKELDTNDAGSRAEWRNGHFRDYLDLALTAADRLRTSRLCWRVIAKGFSRACDLQRVLMREVDETDLSDLQTSSLQRMMELGLAALAAEDLDPGVYGSLILSRLHVLSLALVPTCRDRFAAISGSHVSAIEVLLNEARELHRGLTRRWPTLFEFPEEGDSFDWYADKVFGVAGRTFLRILESAGRFQEFESERQRLASGPHPWAAKEAQLAQPRRGPPDMARLSV